MDPFEPFINGTYPIRCKVFDFFSLTEGKVKRLKVRNCLSACE